MASQTKKGNTAGRKRKLQFSDKELEVLTEECCLHHEVLFGKAAMSVPDSEKKKICLNIQSKINAIGVSHRSIEEVRKRWYDLRSTTKERVAERMKEAHGTGGGPSTLPPPTAIGSMVETTLGPEAVVRIGDLDSSAPGTSKSLPQLTTDDPSVEGGDEATKAAEEAVSIYAEHCNTPTIVPNAPEITEYTDVDNEGVNLKRGPQMRDSQPQRLAGRGRRRHRLTYDASEEDASTQLFLGLEASLISSHRQQNKHMQLMNRNSQRIQQTFTQGFGNVET
ncbi:nuclear apoptosis-inducing factor 1-like [Pleurodeles waltl]|uniref:nuclear apoptosis-inducing factor 1-like n=1 Tax=Pleurodeles waltl TaxID=8319 RepID=UPI0037099845